MFKESPDFDLNLLRVLRALSQTARVSKAAELLGMSQSGFSSALSRLRRHAGEVLFVRTANGMVPTPRALAMMEAAVNILDVVQSGALEAPEFEPASARTEFRLAMSDLAEVVFLPRLLAHLQKVAPHASVQCEAPGEDRLPAALVDGQVDLAVGYYSDLSSQAYLCQRLYRHTFACLVRNDHPLDNGKLTTHAFSQLGHVVITAPSRSGKLFESSLQRRGIQRRIVLRTPHHLSLPAILESTDLIATVPLAVGMRFADVSAVRIVPLPFRPEVFEVKQYWHRRYQHDLRHRWMRQQIAMLFNDTSDKWLALERALYGPELRGKRASKSNSHR